MPTNQSSLFIDHLFNGKLRVWVLQCQACRNREWWMKLNNKRHHDLKSMKCHYLLKMTYCATRLERSGQQQHWYHMSLLRLWPQMDGYGDRLFQIPQRVWGRALNSLLPWGALLQKQNYYGPRYVSSRALCCQNKSLSAGNRGVC